MSIDKKIKEREKSIEELEKTCGTPFLTGMLIAEHKAEIKRLKRIKKAKSKSK